MKVKKWDQMGEEANKGIVNIKQNLKECHLGSVLQGSCGNSAVHTSELPCDERTGVFMPLHPVIG